MRRFNRISVCVIFAGWFGVTGFVALTGDPRHMGGTFSPDALKTMGVLFLFFSAGCLALAIRFIKRRD